MLEKMHCLFLVIRSFDFWFTYRSKMNVRFGAEVTDLA